MQRKELFKSNKALQEAFPNTARNNDLTEEQVPNFEQCYAIGEEGQFIKRFELIKSNGKRYGFSYALLTICIQEDSSLLYLKAYELLIKISGYHLDPIREYMNKEQLLWACASPSGKASDLQSTCIQEINIEGESVMTTV
ncbi:hypothetical protein TPENAI_20056 [Tenacibaculum litopenaei]|uniref:hypothetical protein n=1 Tax=Tenacibaculum litopenaei TaxID=396016 RepID=UPI00389646BD